MSDRGGWDWFEPPGEGGRRQDPAEIETAFARCFGGPDGTQALRHLRDLTFGDDRTGIGQNIEDPQ